MRLPDDLCCRIDAFDQIGADAVRCRADAAGSLQVDLVGLNVVPTARRDDVAPRIDDLYGPNRVVDHAIQNHIRRTRIRDVDVRRSNAADGTNAMGDLEIEIAGITTEQKIGFEIDIGRPGLGRVEDGDPVNLQVFRRIIDDIHILGGVAECEQGGIRRDLCRSRKVSFPLDAGSILQFDGIAVRGVVHTRRIRDVSAAINDQRRIGHADHRIGTPVNRAVRGE